MSIFHTTRWPFSASVHSKQVPWRWKQGIMLAQNGGGGWCLFECNKPISQIAHCTRQEQNFVTALSTHAHISVTKWCIVGYGIGALWNLREESNVEQYTNRTDKNGMLYTSATKLGYVLDFYLLVRLSDRLSFWPNDGLFVIPCVWSVVFIFPRGLFSYLVETVTCMERVSIEGNDLWITGRLLRPPGYEC